MVLMQKLQGGLIRRTKSFLYSGVHHHRIHLSTANGTLPVEQAKAIVDHVFTSQADSLTIVLVQGPAALDVALISFIHEFAEEKCTYERRQITYRIHGSLDGLDEEATSTVIEKNIQLHAWFDGSESLHNAQQSALRAPSWETTLQRLLVAHKAIEKAQNPKDGQRITAEVHVGKTATGQAKTIVQGLQQAKIERFRLMPILEGEHAISPEAYGTFIDDLLSSLETLEKDSPALIEEQIEALSGWIQSGEVSDPLTSTRPATGYTPALQHRRRYLPFLLRTVVGRRW